MAVTGRAFVLGCVLASVACAAAEAEPVALGTGALTAESLVPGVERQREGTGDGTVTDALQRSVHFGNAHALATISLAAYGDGTTPASLAAMGIAGVTRVTTFDNRCTGGYGMYVESPSVSVLAFRGTQTDSPIDIEIDADDAFHDYPFTQNGATAKVHRGFWKQLDSLWTTNVACGVPQGMGAFLTAHASAAPLYFTGHSLGGALADLALAQTFAESTSATPTVQVAGVYTYGGPKVGNDVFAQVLGDHARRTLTPIYRFVHGNDIVPTQPRSIGSTLHTTWQHVKPTGDAEDAFQVWFDDRSARIGTFALFLGFSIEDHSLHGYIADISTNAKARGELH